MRIRIFLSQKRLFRFWLPFTIAFLAAAAWASGASAQPPDPGIGEAAAETGIWTMRRWSPYVVGFLIGVLSWIAFFLSDKPLGVSTAYAKTSGMIEGLIRGSSVKKMEYYRQYVPRIDWEWLLVGGLVIGAFTSAWLSGDFRFEWVPPLWETTFGHTGILRWLIALLGGVIMGIGARWGGGCTSGHGISGTLQLVVGSWISLFCFFIGGIVGAFLLYG